MTTASADPSSASPQPGARAARLRPLALGLAGAWLVAEVLALADAGPSPARLLGGSLTLGFFGAAAAGAFLLHLASPRPRQEKLAAAALGTIFAMALWLAGGAGSVVAGIGLGAGSVVLLAARAWRGAGAERGAALDALLPGLLLPGFVAVSAAYLSLNATLWPTTWDAWAFAADGAFGFQASFVAGRLFEAAPLLATASRVIYILLPLAFVAVEAASIRAPGRPGPDAMVVFLAVALGGYAIYFLFPVAGPAYVFREFPRLVAAAPPLEPLPVVPVPRNCMPSLHAAWALAAFWLARPHGRAVRALTGVFLAFTLLATLGTGYHYLVDLVASVPFTAAAWALVARTTGRERLARLHVVAGAAALLAGWLALVRLAPTALPAPLLWLVAAAVVALPWLAVGELGRHLAAGEAAAGPVAPEARRLRASVGVVFFLSGFAALCYEVVFAKAFAVTYGSTARAATTVLAVYMGGLAVGSWLGGRLATRVARPLRGFALLELGVGLWCALFPLSIQAVRAAYLAIAGGSDPGAPWLVPVQMALQAAALLPATLLMGCSLPFLARFFTDRAEDVGSAVGRLYWINTAGAAAGTVLAGYALLPLLGITRTVLMAVGIDALVALVALRLSRAVERGAAAPAPAAPEAAPAPADGGRLARLGWIALAVTFVGGAITFALETVYIHLLAVVVGNSAYAFSLMVFAFLIGLSAGGVAGRRLLGLGAPPPALLAWLQAGLGAVVLLTVHLWDAIPGHFAAYRGYPLAATFGARETIRFVLASAAMVPPALFIGAAYPVVMAWVGAASPGRVIAAVGRAGAVNTTGNILGAILGGFVLVPHLGSLRAIQALAATALALAALALVAVERRRWPAAALAGAAALFAAQPAGFDLSRLASGANVYFAAQSYGRVVDHAESPDGGLTTIAESRDPAGQRVLTMLTNGKFQGDDSHQREMAAQVSFTLFPLLHTPARGEALVIGLGTGVSARVASDAGFARVHVAELARDVVDLADRHFRSVNGGVLARPNTEVHVTDGRNLLALSPRRYDLIGLEVSSIWFAGAASLYNREFYEVARERLAERGVLQQWIQLHHLSRADVLSILATARSVFPRVWLYFAPNQGVLVGCAWDCRPTPEAVRRLEGTPALGRDLDLVGGARRLLEQRVLGPDEVDRLLTASRDFGLEPADLVSTDDNLMLEYSTPRGNVREYLPSLRDNLDFVGRLRPAATVAGTALAEADLPAPRQLPPGAAAGGGAGPAGSATP